MEDGMLAVVVDIEGMHGSSARLFDRAGIPGAWKRSFLP
jgi:hypothetical protein